MLYIYIINVKQFTHLTVKIDQPVDAPQLVWLQRTDKHFRLCDFLHHLNSRIGKTKLTIDWEVWKLRRDNTKEIRNYKTERRDYKAQAYSKVYACIHMMPSS